MAVATTSFLTATMPFLQPPPSRPSPAPISAPFCAPPSSLRSFSTPRRSAVLRVSAMALKWEPSKVAPQADRVLIRLEEVPEKSAGGVLLPKAAVKFERYLMGEILSVGSDAGDLEAGKKVLFSDVSAYEVDLGTEARHCFCHAGDLLAVVE